MFNFLSTKNKGEVMLQIYVSDLSAYNKGQLIGKWISLPCDDLDVQLQEVLREGEQLCLKEYGYFELHEEYFITDYEWDELVLFSVKAHSDIASLNNDLLLLDGLESYDLKSIKYLLDDGIASTIKEALEKMEDVLAYESSTLEEFGMNIIAQTYGLDVIPDYIQSYIDYEGYAKDLILGGEFTQTQYGFYSYLQ